MRIVNPVLLVLSVLSVLCAGCGGGGGDGGDNDGEVLLAQWPFSFRIFSEQVFETVDVEFVRRVGIDRVGPVLATGIGDGDVGRFPRIGVANGGGDFLDVSDRLVNGVDDELGVMVIEQLLSGPGAFGRFQLESEGLQPFVPAGPDLAPSLVTAFQLELTVANFEDSTTPPPEKQSPGGNTRVITGIDVHLEGTIRILGIPPAE